LLQIRPKPFEFLEHEQTIAQTVLGCRRSSCHARLEWFCRWIQHCRQTVW